jgi:hypothetical protein
MRTADLKILLLTAHIVGNEAAGGREEKGGGGNGNFHGANGPDTGSTTLDYGRGNNHDTNHLEAKYRYGSFF